MEIKIELPGNVKVSCPTAHCAITILRCVSFRAEQAAADSEGKPPSAKNISPLGWQTIGSGLDGRGDGWVSAADTDSSREVDDYGVDDAEFEESVVEAQIVNFGDEGDDEPDTRSANDAGSGFPYLSYEGPDDIEETQQILPGLEQEPTSLEEEDELQGERSQYVREEQHRTTRSRFSVSLSQGLDDILAENDKNKEEEEFEAEVRSSREAHNSRRLFQPIENRLGDRAKAVFDFIQTRLVFSTDDVRVHAAQELGMNLNKKNKKKLRKALKLIEKAGLIEKTDKGEWRKVV